MRPGRRFRLFRRHSNASRSLSGALDGEADALTHPLDMADSSHGSLIRGTSLQRGTHFEQA